MNPKVGYKLDALAHAISKPACRTARNLKVGKSFERSKPDAYSRVFWLLSARQTPAGKWVKGVSQASGALRPREKREVLLGLIVADATTRVVVEMWQWQPQGRQLQIAWCAP